MNGKRLFPISISAFALIVIMALLIGGLGMTPVASAAPPNTALRFVQQPPASTYLFAPFSAQVEVYDTTTNDRVDIDGEFVTLWLLRTLDYGAIDTGYASAELIDGVATFTGLLVTEPLANGYSLQANWSDLFVVSNLIAVEAGEPEFYINAPPTAPLSINKPFSLQARIMIPGTPNVFPEVDGLVVTLQEMDETGTNVIIPIMVTAATVDGFVTFSNIRVTDLGTFRFRLIAEGINSATTDAYFMNPLSMDWTQQPPTTATTTETFSISMQLVDSLPGGSVIDVDGAGVTLALVDLDAGSIVNPSFATASTVDGTATFNGLQITVPGRYRFHANGHGMHQGITGEVTITSATPLQELYFNAPPEAPILIFRPFGVQVRVHVPGTPPTFPDVDGAIVHLSLYDETGTAEIAPFFMNAAMVDGYATFSGIVIEQLGIFRLQAMTSGMPPVMTDPFTVEALYLNYAQQPPTSVGVNEPFMVVVNLLEEQFTGSVVDVDGGNVSLGLMYADTGILVPGGAGYAQATIVDGVATFTGLTVSEVGRYKFNASAYGTNNAVSSEFEVTGGPAETPTDTPTETPTDEPTATPTGMPTEEPTATATPEPDLPTPPPAPSGNDMNFDPDGAVRTGIPDRFAAFINIRQIVVDGEFMRWNGGSLTDSGFIGNEGILGLGVIQAVDIFSPNGLTYFDGGIVMCLRGEGTLIWLAASQMPRVPQVIGSYRVPEFPGYTCATLFEPGTLILTQRNPIR